MLQRCINFEVKIEVQVRQYEVLVGEILRWTEETAERFELRPIFKTSSEVNQQLKELHVFTTVEKPEWSKKLQKGWNLLEATQRLVLRRPGRNPVKVGKSIYVCLFLCVSMCVLCVCVCVCFVLCVFTCVISTQNLYHTRFFTLLLKLGHSGLRQLPITCDPCFLARNGSCRAEMEGISRRAFALS